MVYDIKNKVNNQEEFYYDANGMFSIVDLKLRDKRTFLFGINYVSTTFK
jgi:hypothetical protein